jgi:hypothetical protein
MDTRQTLADLQTLLDRQTAILADCPAMAVACTITTPHLQGIALAAQLCLAAVHAADARDSLRAAVDTLAAILEPQIPGQAAGDAAAEALAMQELIEATMPRTQSSDAPTTHQASCCIICHLTHEELYARGIGWATNGICMRCAEPIPVGDLIA